MIFNDSYKNGDFLNLNAVPPIFYLAKSISIIQLSYDSHINLVIVGLSNLLSIYIIYIYILYI